MNIWLMVLAFPHQLAAMTMPSAAAMALKILTINSLDKMMITTQALINPSWTKQTKADVTSNLSAKGSINLPKFVINLYFLARYPSKKSVKDARANTINAHKSYPPNNKKIKNGIMIILKIVSWLAMFIFIFNHSYQVVF